MSLDLKEHRNYISQDQTHIKLLDTVNLKDENLSIHDTFQSTIGKLIWTSCQTRLDISFDVCHLASNLKNSTLAGIKHLNKVISHLKQSNISLTQILVYVTSNILIVTNMYIITCKLICN